ncbi:uncharacterized protein LOC121407624 [Lytechinus variegatus]|uniref:uncharacterized protein LOC121407624 n=1 Tax=Lytechinus variegatus TaxID=7654 RepID=UPI001BB2243C|nr:uncharacterized protein LOC121407624 [Lytechinus variegatus]
MSIPLSATIARLKPLRDKPSLVLVFPSVGNPGRNHLLTRTVLAIIIITLLANASFVGAETTSTTPPVLPQDEAGDMLSHTPEGLPKVASTAFFLIALFLFSIGISYFFKYYVFSRDRKEWCCEKQSQVAVSPESMGLKDNTSRQNTPENGNAGKTGLYANIFARSYDSDEEEIRQLQLEALKAELSSDNEIRVGKKAAKPTKSSILKALETADRWPRLSVQQMTSEDKAGNGRAVKTAASIWKEKALKKSDENKNNIPEMTVVDIGNASNGILHPSNSNNVGLTSVVVHRNPSPIPSSDLSMNEAGLSLPADRQENGSIIETPRTDISIGLLSVRPKSGQGDLDGYSADFESVSLYSELSNITELQKSMDSRSVRANTAKRKNPTRDNFVSPANDSRAGENVSSKEMDDEHSRNHTINASNNAHNSLHGSCQDLELKHFNTKGPESQAENDAASEMWANKVIPCDNPPASMHVTDDNQSNTNPTLAITTEHTSQAPGLSSLEGENAIKTSSEDEKPGTPESGTPLLLTDEGSDDQKHQTPKETSDLVEGNRTPSIYAKYANNAKLPNKHVMGDADEADEPSTSAKPHSPVKPARNAEQKGHGSSPNKVATSKSRTSSAASKPSGGTPRNKTGARKPNPQKKKNVTR